MQIAGNKLLSLTNLDSVMKTICRCYMAIISFGYYGMTLLLYMESLPLAARVICLVGYTLFVISDSVLSYNLWVSPSYKLNFVVMLTYYMAQFLLTIGYVWCKNDSLLEVF